MKEIIVSLTDEQHNLLKQYANINKIDLKEYATNIVRGWADSHIAGFYINKIRTMKHNELEVKLGKIELGGR